MWLAIFYLAPLWTLLKISLSSKETRFAVFPTFSWEFSNYGKAFSDFGPQFTRAFLYAGIATALTILIGYPIAYVIAFSRRALPQRVARTRRHSVLHELSHQNDRLDVDPRRQRSGRESARHSSTVRCARI